MRRSCGFLLILLLAFTLRAASARADDDFAVELAAPSVDITTGFSGAHVALFGVKEGEGDVAVVVRGPGHNMVVRRKQPVLGVWMNRESAHFSNVPVYYDLALSRPENVIAADDVRQENQIGLDSLRFVYMGTDGADREGLFREALIRNKQVQGHFPLEPAKITFLNGKFFRTDFYLPADVPTGVYRIAAYLLRDGRIAARQEISMRVAQVGTSAQIQRFAWRHGVLYGLGTVALALMFGMAANLVLRRD